MDTENFYQRCEEFFITAGATSLVEALKSVHNADKAEKFRIVLAGGISRGKTRLLNQLLTTDIFPESAIPATTILTETLYGPKPAIFFETVSGREEIAPTREALSAFCAGETRSDDNGFLRAFMPSPLLNPDLALYDTPGIDDILSARANVVYDTLEAADAILVVISAANPLGIIERNFIEAAQNRAITPHIALVVAFLDNLSEKDQLKQLQFIKDKIDHFGQGLEIWTTLENAPGNPAVSGINAIGERLKAWRNDEKLTTLRTKAYLRKLFLLIQDAIAEEKLKLTAAAEARNGNRDALLSSLDDLEKSREEWENIKNSFTDASKPSIKGLLEDLEKLRIALIEDLSREDSQTFSLNLRSRLNDAASGLAGRLRADFEKAQEELAEKAGARFGPLESFSFEPVKTFALGYTLPELEATESEPGGILAILVNFARAFWRDVTNRLPLPSPLRDRLNDLANSALGHFLPSSGLDFKKRAERELDAFFTSLSLQLERGATALYSDAADCIAREQRRWLSEKREILEKIHSPAQAGEKMRQFEKVITQGESLAAEIARACAELA